MKTHLEIKRIDLWSLFRIAFFLYAIIGLIVGLCYAFFIFVMGAFESAFIGDEFGDFGGLRVFSGVMGVILIPVFAFFYGAFGSVFVTIGGFMYNLIAKLAGGLRFETIAEAGPPEADSASYVDTPPTI